jgi:hypothetical protein
MRALVSIAAGRGLSRRRRRVGLRLLAAPIAVRFLVFAAAAVAIWLAVNWIYQVIRKPTELLAPVSGVMAKSPPETWRRYKPLFREYSTDVVSPELLAALAQVEGQGNPLARTYWRWSLAWNPFELYRPASSAVGMYQFLDEKATRYCIRDHVAIEGGPWYDPRSCWLRGLSTRIVPSHAVEVTSAYLDRAVAAAVARRRPPPSLRQKQDLAAVIHLCGAGRGESFARRNFRVAPRERCGDQDVSAYLARVNALKREFSRLAATG